MTTRKERNAVAAVNYKKRERARKAQQRAFEPRQPDDMLPEVLTADDDGNGSSLRTNSTPWRLFAAARRLTPRACTRGCARRQPRRQGAARRAVSV